MKFFKTLIPDVVVVEPCVFSDARGAFMEAWRSDAFADAGIAATFVQDNHSFSRQWVLRGLHYQIRQPQGKLVRVTRGEAFDVAVDLRRSSRTFGRWVAAILSESNRRMMWVPPGFAHGFLALSDQVEVMYKCTDYYSPESQRSLRWNDPEIGIAWPLPPRVEPILSDRDAAASLLTAAETYS
jgi:dTDP-4-dehydrorhamnose 3,5-epimerase